MFVLLKKIPIKLSTKVESYNILISDIGFFARTIYGVLEPMLYIISGTYLGAQFHIWDITHSPNKRL
jgi:hypothetical protein